MADEPQNEIVPPVEVPAVSESPIVETAPEDNSVGVGESDQPQAPPPEPLSSNQKLLFTALVVALFAILVLLSRNLISNVRDAQPTPSLANSSSTPEATAPASLYGNDTYGFSFKIPKGWIVENPLGTVTDTVALKLQSDSRPCFPDLTVCPIIIEVKDNPKGLSPDAFGVPFYPPQDAIRGGQDTLIVGGRTATVLYNINGTGGQLVYIPKPGSVMKISLQDSPSVSFENLQLFEKFLGGIIFTK